MNIYKLEYVWYDDSDEANIITALDEEEFTKLIIVGLKQINSFSEEEMLDRYPSTKEMFDNKSFHVKCLPEAFDLLIEFLTRNNCVLGTIYPDHKFLLEDCYDNEFNLVSREQRIINTPHRCYGENEQ